jgi:UDP-N-acetylglucosamine acyltransferase
MPIHSSAIIDTQAHIPASCDIGPNVVIEGPVKLGENVKVYPNAYISGWTEIGDRVQIHPGAVVGHLPQDFHYGGERSYCKIGAGTIIREFSSIHRGTQPESSTILGENCFILGYAHIGHNCELADGVKLYNSGALAGHVTIGESSIVGGYGLVHQFARIGEYVMIGGGTRITKDIPPFMKALHESKCVGYNSIGLRRAGKFSKAEIDEARLAYRMLYHTDRPFRTAFEEFSGLAKTTTGKRVVEFVNGPSKLGIAGGRRSAANDDMEDGDSED